MMGSIGDLYKSVEGLKENYFVPDNQPKDSLLSPSIPKVTAQTIAPLKLPDYQPKDISYLSIAENPRASCRCCLQSMSTQLRFVSYKPKSAGEGGYVKDEVAYMVADDLMVEPLTTASVMIKINGTKNVGLLDEKVVCLDMDKGLELLKASLQSKAVLTSVFLSDYKA